MKMYILTFAIGIPLSLVLIPLWGIDGMIISTLLSGVPSLFAGLHMVWRKYGAKIDFRAQAKTIVASMFATGLTYLFLQIFAGAYWIRLTLGLIVFLFVFVISAPLFGAINQTDIKNLRGMLSGLVTISKILELPLSVIQKIIDISHNSKGAFRNNHP